MKTLSLTEFIHPVLIHQSARTVLNRQGAAGPDGISVEVFEKHFEKHCLVLLEELRSGAYIPGVGTRVFVTKENGGERALVVHNIRDRIAQRVLAQGIAKRVKLDDASFAYRDGLGAQQAIHRALEYHKAGRQWVVRADIHQFFDHVSHAQLLEKLGAILDTNLLELVQRVIRAPVLDGRSKFYPEIGLPQGGGLSPLLANFFLDDFDKTVGHTERGLVRFADDFVICCATASNAGLALEVAERALNRLELKLNIQKTRILSIAQGYDFLGFSFQNDTVRVSPKRKDEFKAHLEHLLSPRFGNVRPGAIKHANDLIRGWRNYFALGHVREDFILLDEWISARFHAQIGQLEVLTPAKTFHHAAAPTLGGYDRVRPSKPVKAAKPTPTAKPRVSSMVTFAVNGYPESVQRGHEKISISSLALVSPTPALEQVLLQLRSAALFHRATFATRWTHPEAVLSICQIAKAMATRCITATTVATYDHALMTCVPMLEEQAFKSARGALRRALRIHAWTALLEAGMDIGTQGSEGKTIPILAVALADALEAPISDYVLLASARQNKLNNVTTQLEIHLERPVQYHNHSTTWRNVLRCEAQQISSAIRNNSHFQAWLEEANLEHLVLA